MEIINSLVWVHIMFGFEVCNDTILKKALGLEFQNCKYRFISLNVNIASVFCFSENILFKGHFSISHSVLNVFSECGVLSSWSTLAFSTRLLGWVFAQAVLCSVSTISVYIFEQIVFSPSGLLPLGIHLKVRLPVQRV